MAINKRFEVVSSQGTFEVFKIIVDTKTGVNYLYVTNGTSGRLSPLLDSEGNPIITK